MLGLRKILAVIAIARSQLEEARMKVGVWDIEQDLEFSEGYMGLDKNETWV
jgi:hypothetical protein